MSPVQAVRFYRAVGGQYSMQGVLVELRFKDAHLPLVMLDSEESWSWSEARSLFHVAPAWFCVGTWGKTCGGRWKMRGTSLIYYA